MLRNWAILALIVLCAAAGAYYLLYGRAAPPPLAQEIIVPPVPVSTPPAPAPAPPPGPIAVELAIVHPLASTPTALPLPELDQSDAAIIKALRDALGTSWRDLFVPETVIRNIVATVDNLPRHHLPAKVVPLKRIPGAFIVAGDGGELSIGASNRERYAATVRLLAAIDSAQLVAVYRQFYPLFQRAYGEIGFPNAYFNDRLIEAIDDLLAAPDPDEPISLVQPKVLYRFADAQMEARSAGQKIMIRMGRENAAPLKEKLREIRQHVAQGGGASRP